MTCPAFVQSPPHCLTQGIPSVEVWNARVQERQLAKEEVNRRVLDPATPNEEKMVGRKGRWREWFAL